MQLPLKIYAFLFGVIAVVALGAYISFLRDDQLKKGLTSAVPARVTNTEVRRLTDPETGMDRAVDVIVSFEFVLNGQKYQQVVRMNKTAAIPFIPWGDAKVCYDPGDPKTIEKARLFPASFVCGG